MVINLMISFPWIHTDMYSTLLNFLLKMYYHISNIVTFFVVNCFIVKDLLRYSHIKACKKPWHFASARHRNIYLRGWYSIIWLSPPMKATSTVWQLVCCVTSLIEAGFGSGDMPWDNVFIFYECNWILVVIRENENGKLLKGKVNHGQAQGFPKCGL